MQAGGEGFQFAFPNFGLLHKQPFCDCKKYFAVWRAKVYPTA